MDLQWDCSKCDHFLDSSGKIAVFTKMAEIISTDPSRGHILNAPCYFLPTKWQKLVKKIQVMMLSMFEHYFRRKHWFQQSVTIMDDIAYALEKNRLVRPMARYLDAEIEKFLHVMTYGQTISMNDISKLFGWNDSPKSQGELRQILEDNTFVYRIYSMNKVYAIFDIPGPEIRRFVDIALTSLRSHNRWIKLKLKLDSHWRIKSRSRSPRLPPEVCEIVIDFLALTYVPNLGLANICFTCRTFLGYCRKHRYKHITLKEHSSTRYFIKSLSQYPYLRQLTTNIMIMSDDAKTYHEIFRHGQPLLPNLQSVSLSHMPPLHPTLISMRRPFHSVKTLKICNCTFVSMLDLRRLRDNFFPNLAHLDLQHQLSINSSYVAVPSSLPPRNPLSLSSLRLGSQQIPPVVFKWLSWTQAPRTVWSLHIRASILDEMLPSFGQHLQILNLKWDISRSEIYTDISFGIDVLPALQTLVINYLYQRDVDAFCDVLLRTNTSSTLSCIRFWFSSFRKLSSPFKLRFGSQDSARDSDFGKVGGEHEYSKLDDTLAQLPRDVRIEIEEEYWKHLPKLKLKGVLKIPTASRWQ